jgi:outer membrane protein assembly factor BamB
MTSGNTLFYPAAIWIDNVQLTDQGRSAVDRSRDERSVTIDLANGTRKKYVKSVKHTFSTKWEYLPDDSTCTIDGYAARDTMVKLFGDSSDSHTLRFFYENGKYEEFTVFVTDYKESLIRRDASSGVFMWTVDVGFEES